jgi:hypothetical protein
MARLQGDSRSLEDIERGMARDDMNANEMRIDNVREFGANPERRADLQHLVKGELYRKQHSDSLEKAEQKREFLGGNTGTEELAQDQLAVEDSMLEVPKDPFGFAPRELKAEVGRDEFNQIDKNLTTTLEVQRTEKIEHSEHIAKIFSSIAKVAALVTMQPELIMLIDVVSGLGDMAIKKSVAGEAYDPADDAKMLGITATIDAATLGISKIGKLGGAVTVGEDAARLGEKTAVKSLEEGTTKEAKAEIVQEGVSKAAGDSNIVGLAPREPSGLESVAKQEASKASDAAHTVEELQTKQVADNASSADGLRFPSGMGYVGEADEETIRAYQRIAATDGDAAKIASSLGIDEDIVAQVKQHLFVNEYDLPVVNEQANTVSMMRGQFTPSELVAEQWNRALEGMAPGSDEEAEFRRFLSHEYIEKGLMAKGMPYKAIESFGDGPYGFYSYPTAEFHGAHDLAPATNPFVDPFLGWKSIFGESIETPTLHPDLSNLPDVLEQIKRVRGPGQP